MNEAAGFCERAGLRQSSGTHELKPSTLQKFSASTLFSAVKSSPLDWLWLWQQKKKKKTRTMGSSCGSATDREGPLIEENELFFIVQNEAIFLF